MRWSPQGTVLASGSDDRTVRVWDIPWTRCPGTRVAAAAGISGTAKNLRPAGGELCNAATVCAAAELSLRAGAEAHAASAANGLAPLGLPAEADNCSAAGAGGWAKAGEVRPEGPDAPATAAPGRAAEPDRPAGATGLRAAAAPCIRELPATAALPEALQARQVLGRHGARVWDIAFEDEQGDALLTASEDCLCRCAPHCRALMLPLKALSHGSEFSWHPVLLACMQSVPAVCFTASSVHIITKCGRQTDILYVHDPLYGPDTELSDRQGITAGKTSTILARLKLCRTTENDPPCLLRVWRSGKCVAVLQGHRGRGVWRCALLAGGSAVTAGADGSLKLWPLANFGVQPTPTENVQHPGSMQPDRQVLLQQAPCGPGGLRTVTDTSAAFAGSKQRDKRVGGVRDRADGGGWRCPPGVEALVLDYAHLGSSAAAAEAERLHSSENPRGSGYRVHAPPAGHDAGGSTSAPPLCGGESAGASGQAVFFRRADGSTAPEWVQCLGFGGSPSSPDPGLLFVATQRGLLHRVHLTQGLDLSSRASWQRVWACPLEGHPMCMAVRSSSAAVMQDSSTDSVKADGVHATGPAPGTPVDCDLLLVPGAALQGCSDGGDAGLGLAKNAAEPALSGTGAVCRRIQTCAAWDSVLLGGFTGWAACVWVPAALDAERASDAARIPTGLDPAADNACASVRFEAASLQHGAQTAAGNAAGHRRTVSPEPSGSRHGAAASAAACAAEAQAGRDSPGGGSVPGAKAVCWQAHPASAVHRILWVPELGPRYITTTDSLGALRLWRLLEPPVCMCSHSPGKLLGSGLSGCAAVPCICHRDSCPHPGQPSSGSWAGPAGAGADMVEQGSRSGSGAGSAAGAPQLWAEACSPYGEPLTCMAVAPTRRMLVAGDALGSILVFELPSEGAAVLSLQHRPHYHLQRMLSSQYDAVKVASALLDWSLTFSSWIGNCMLDQSGCCPSCT